MTGNTVHIADQFASLDWRELVVGLSVLLAFLAGSVIGRTIIEAGARQRYRRVASLTLIFETALIALVASLSAATAANNFRTGLLVVLAVAMGLQTAALTRVGPLTVHTTFVTGMLNKLAQLISHALFLSYDTAIRRRPLIGQRRRVFRETAYIFSIWFMYFAGAALGAHVTLVAGLVGLFVPAALLIVAISVDQVQPLSLQEEFEEEKKAA